MTIGGEPTTPGMRTIAAAAPIYYPDIITGKEIDAQGRERYVKTEPKSGRVWFMKVRPDTQVPEWEKVMREEKQERKGGQGQEVLYNVRNLQVDFIGQDGRKYSLVKRSERIASETRADIGHGRTTADLGWHLFSYATPTGGEPTEMMDFQTLTAGTSLPAVSAQREIYLTQ